MRESDLDSVEQIKKREAISKLAQSGDAKQLMKLLQKEKNMRGSGAGSRGRKACGADWNASATYEYAGRDTADREYQSKSQREWIGRQVRFD